MNTGHRRILIVFACAVFLLLLCVDAWVTRQELAIQLTDAAWAEHTRLVLGQLRLTESLLADAETGQRGFLYTGSREYLAPYDSAVSRIQREIDTLGRLTADNPQEQARISRLRRLAAAKLAEMAETLRLSMSGHSDQARALVLSGTGLGLMSEFRGVIAEMRSEEMRLSEARSAAYQRSSRRTIASIYTSTALAAVAFLLLAFYMLRNLGLRERHAHNLEEREEWFRSTLTSLGDGVIATDAQGRVTFVNTVSAKLLGVAPGDVVGHRLEQVFCIFNEVTRLPVENPVRKVLELGRIVGLANHTLLQRSDGSFVPIEDSAAPISDSTGKCVGVVLVFRDATAERKSQELLRRTEKLAAAARLSATVAHEINNPLEAIGNLIYLTRHTPGLPEEVTRYLTMADEELNRVSHITRQTLGFYRDTGVAAEVDLREIVTSVLALYSNKLRARNIRVETSFEDCPPLHGLAGELKQVVANLISNAADAVDSGGFVRVHLRCTEDAAGRKAVLRVEDNGTGISPENMSRIFEPFFTTKKDVGTGLGLWVCKEIVSRHGGVIELESPRENGHAGTVFSLTLPVDGFSNAADLVV